MNKVIKNYNKIHYGEALEDSTEVIKWINSISDPNHNFINGDWIKSSSNRSMSSINPATVQVRVEVEEDTWDSLAMEDFEATIDVLNLPEGLHQLSVDVTPLRSPGNLRITQIVPDPIEIGLTPLFSKSVPVIVDIVGNPSNGYQLGEPQLESEDVIVSGTIIDDVNTPPPRLAVSTK